MKKPFMDALYYGEVRPFERSVEPCARRDAVETKIKEEKSYLKGQLSSESTERLEKLEELYTQSSAFEYTDCFACGLRFGILLMIEVLE